jgi:Mn2+/Fe2+ NRAMP family transporter
VPVTTAPFSPPADRRFALDRAHLGDIVGALGTVPAADTGPRRSLRRRALTLLAIMGPGLVVMAADADAGSLAVFSQAGQNYGLSLLWVVVALAPVLFVHQEMVVRLGAVTGVGHARLIFERFGRLWGSFAVGDLLLLNLLTIVTELIGVSLALGYFGVSRYVAVPLAAAVLVLITAGGSFRRWERVMYVLVATNLLVVPLALLTAHHPSSIVAHGVVPGIDGGWNAPAALFVVALVGTIVAPWQLFFQQSNVVDKRISARWLNYERIDTLIGTVLFTVCAAAVIVVFALAFGGGPLHGGFTDAGAAAEGLGSRLGFSAGAVFALALLNASVLGAAAVTLASSYAIGDTLGLKHSLHRSWRDARLFHLSFAVFVGAGAAVVLIPGTPLGIVTTGVQALAGVLLPSASVFLLLLCNDREVLGPWTNPPWLNALAGLIVGGLVVLSGTITITTVLPTVDATTVAAGLGGVLAVVLLWLVVAARVSPRKAPPPAPDCETPWEARTWTMPSLESLGRPALSRGRTVGLVVLRAYLTLAAAMVVVRVVELALDR